MMFSLKPVKTGFTHSIRLEEKYTGAALEVVPSLGGTVHSLSLVPQTGDKARPILYGDTPDELISNPWFRGRVLFPFNDRIPAGNYTFRGEEYSLPPNDKESGDAIHGFLYRIPLSVTGEESDNGCARITLSGQISNEEGYPFTPNLSIQYTLHPSLFRIDFHISNKSDTPLPWSLGWHPYFFIPGRRDSLGKNGDCGKWRLTLPADRYVEVDRDLLPTGRKPDVNDSAFDFREGEKITDQELDLAFENRQGWTRLSGEDLEIRLEQDIEHFPFTQVFTHPDRRSVALEPVTAATNAFNHPDLGLSILEPGEEIQTWVQVRTLYAG